MKTVYTVEQITCCARLQPVIPILVSLEVRFCPLCAEFRMNYRSIELPIERLRPPICEGPSSLTESLLYHIILVFLELFTVQYLIIDTLFANKHTPLDCPFRPIILLFLLVSVGVG